MESIKRGFLHSEGMSSSVLFPIDWHNFDHVVLDFGGVLYDIDHQRTASAFSKLGLQDFSDEFRHSAQSALFDQLECGTLSNEAFLRALRDRCADGTTLEDVRAAWNALLIGLKPEAVDWVRMLSTRFDLLMFSNTNDIHATHFEQDILRTRSRSFSDAFRQIIYSHRLGHRKPSPMAFKKVADLYDLNPKRTLFIDDTQENVAGALQAGWSAVYFDVKAHSLPSFMRGTSFIDFVEG